MHPGVTSRHNSGTCRVLFNTCQGHEHFYTHTQTHTHRLRTFQHFVFSVTQARNFSALRRWLVPYHWSVTSYTGYALQLWLTSTVRILWTYIPTTCPNWYARLTSSEQWRCLRRALGTVSFTNTCYSFDPRSRLRRHVESHRPTLFDLRALYSPSFLPNLTAAICSYTSHLHIHIPHSYQIFIQVY